MIRDKSAKKQANAAKGRDRGCAAELSARARADQARRLAGGRLRRGGARSAGRPGGGGRRRAGPEANPKRHRRFQAADSRTPRGTVRGNLRDGVLCGRLCLAGANRPRQYFARFAVGACPCGARAAGNAEACVCRRPRPDRHALRLRRRDRRRRDRDVDRGRLDHRQGDARPPDVCAGAGLPGLRFRDPQGLCRAGASRGAGPARAERSSPPFLRPRRSPRGKNIIPRRSNAIFSLWIRSIASEIPSEVSATIYGRLPRRLPRSIKRPRTSRPPRIMAFRTFHAFHLPGCRTDPRPAAAGGLARGAAAGGAVADAADAALSQPARRSRHRAGVWPGISGRHLVRSAARVLARRYRVPRRRQPRVRRLSAGAALCGRDVLELLSARRAPSSAASRRCSRCCSR